jgi:hypothetical protein
MKKLRVTVLLIMLALLAMPLFADAAKDVDIGSFGGWHTIITAVLGVLGLVAGGIATKFYKTINRIRGFVEALDNAFDDHKITSKEWQQIITKFKEIAEVWKPNKK